MLIFYAKVIVLHEFKFTNCNWKRGLNGYYSLTKADEGSAMANLKAWAGTFDAVKETLIAQKLTLVLYLLRRTDPWMNVHP